MTWNALFAASIVILAVVLIHQGGPKKAFYLMTALLPATGFFVDIGVSLSASKVIGLILCFSLLATWLQQGVTGRVQSLGLVFLLYAAVVTTVGRILAPVPTLDSTELRVEMRPFVQMFSLFLQMLPLFLAPLILRSKADILATVKAFFWGTGLLAFGGVLQGVIYWIWGFNAFSIYREGLFGETMDVGKIDYAGDVIYRSNSLAREPKDMGAALAIAAITWLLLRSAGVIKSFVLSCLYIGLLLLAAVLSFSTSAAFILCIGAVVVIPTSIAIRLKRGGNSLEVENENTRGQHSARHTWLIKPAAAAISIAICLGVIFLWYETIIEMMPYFSDLFSLRVLDRIGEIEDFDEVTLEFLTTEPHWALFGVGTGNLPWYAFSYLRNDHPDFQYMQSLTWNAKSGLLAMLTSYGFMGLCILGSIIGIVLSVLLRGIRHHHRELETILAAVGILVFIVGVHALRAVDDFFWLALGVAVAQAQLHAIAPLQLQSVRLQAGTRSPAS